MTGSKWAEESKSLLMVSFEKTGQRTEAFSTLHSVVATEYTRDGGVSASHRIVAKYVR